MRFRPEQLMVYGFGLVVAIVLLITGLSLHTSARWRELNERITHTHEVREELARTTAAVSAAETFQRLYIISGGNDTLQAYQTARDKVLPQLQRVDILIADNPHQRRRIVQLQADTELRLRLLENVLQIRQTRGYAAASQQIALGQGKRAMADVMSDLAAMDAEEERLLVQRTAAQHNYGTSVTWIFASFCLVVLAALGGVFFGIRQTLQSRQQATEDARTALRISELSEERLQAAISAMQEGFTLHNERAEIVLCNPQAEEILGLSADQIRGSSPMDPRWKAIRLDGSEWSAEKRPAVTALRTGVAIRDMTMGIYRPDGTLTWMVVNAVPLRAADESSPHGVVVTFTDITRRKQLEEEKERLMQLAIEQADRDPLTGLYNHRTFQHRLHIAEERSGSAESQDVSYAVAVLDMDNFKFFNDTYGHLVGDDVLGTVARALQECCLESDVVARIGGDEFAILTSYTHPEDVHDWTERLYRTVNNVFFQPPGEAAGVPLRLSVGVARFPDEGAAMTDVLYLADKRAMQNKGGGTAGAVAEPENIWESLSKTVKDFSMLDALIAAVDFKDRYTRRHSEDVMRYALQIAAILGLPEAETESLRMAALLHDVGKIGVPNYVLRRPGVLSPEEFAIIKQHAELGGILVGTIPELRHTVDGVRHHHEHWDGSGYPSGLRGEDIPLAARILAVADSYSAMTMDRPYRKGFSTVEATNRLRTGAGIQWDINCVNALLTSLEVSLTAPAHAPEDPDDLPATDATALFL